MVKSTVNTHEPGRVCILQPQRVEMLNFRGTMELAWPTMIGCWNHRAVFVPSVEKNAAVEIVYR